MEELLRFSQSGFFGKMYPGGYTAEVTSLSPKATEEDVYNFFGHCGAVEHVEIIRSGEYASTAYVTFRDAFALQTAILLSGARIVDQCVCITSWGSYIDESDAWNGSTYPEGNTSSTTYHSSQFVSTPGEAVTVVKTLASKGYVLGKDALTKAKAFDESHQLSATAAAKVCELSDRIGLTEKIHAGREVVKTVDEKFHVSDITKSAATVTGTAVVVAATYTGEAAVAAGSAVVNSSYFAKGALWFSDVLTRASKAAADLGSHGGN
ncbi:binding partner of ACD11 1-like isoform X1 [Malus sylvestris]|nr:binding partner of ACD11 1-like isoform X1 [Malus domestica]XP_050104147.1 binding partner of ACD11 1-like isoform X1 [Malus sylvestris]